MEGSGGEKSIAYGPGGNLAPRAAGPRLVRADGSGAGRVWVGSHFFDSHPGYTLHTAQRLGEHQENFHGTLYTVQL